MAKTIYLLSCKDAETTLNQVTDELESNDYRVLNMHTKAWSDQVLVQALRLIRDSDLIIPIFSQQAIQDDNFNYQLYLARHEDKPIIVLRTDTTIDVHKAYEDLYQTINIIDDHLPDGFLHQLEVFLNTHENRRPSQTKVISGTQLLSLQSRLFVELMEFSGVKFPEKPNSLRVGIVELSLGLSESGERGNEFWLQNSNPNDSFEVEYAGKRYPYIVANLSMNINHDVAPRMRNKLNIMGWATYNNTHNTDHQNVEVIGSQVWENQEHQINNIVRIILEANALAGYSAISNI